MIIVGDNLKALIKQKNIVDVQYIEKCYDSTAIVLSLGDEAIYMSSTAVDTLCYGEEIPQDCLHKQEINSSGLIIHPHTSVLCSSLETIRMPVGYFGLLQTKGSLARLFVSLHFSDGQIDPGFNGKVTFEIYNASSFNIKIMKGQPVGNLYIIKTSTHNHTPYNGKYQDAKGPTISK